MGPGDPVFNNQTVCQCLERLGYSSVRSLQASGNYLFESGETDATKLEADIEMSIEQAVGFRRAAIVKNADDIARLIASDPFDGMTHNNRSYLLVTFTKQTIEPDFAVPYQPPGKPYTIVGVTHNTLYSIVDNTAAKTPDLMVWLERQFGKDISSRTWNTVLRIHQKLAM